MRIRHALSAAALGAALAAGALAVPAQAAQQGATSAGVASAPAATAVGSNEGQVRVAGWVYTDWYLTLSDCRRAGRHFGGEGTHWYCAQYGALWYLFTWA